MCHVLQFPHHSNTRLGNTGFTAFQGSLCSRHSGLHRINDSHIPPAAPFTEKAFPKA
jgi:hypothetical protein